MVTLTRPGSKISSANPKWMHIFPSVFERKVDLTTKKVLKAVLSKRFFGQNLKLSVFLIRLIAFFKLFHPKSKTGNNSSLMSIISHNVKNSKFGSYQIFFYFHVFLSKLCFKICFRKLIEPAQSLLILVSFLKKQ